MNSGKLKLDGASASLGTGDVTVDGVGLVGATLVAAGKLRILSGVSDAISNSATLSLTGGGTVDVADVGAVELGSTETANQLVLGGVGQAPGTYGATGSGATNILDEYFAGSGILTVLSAGAGGGGAVPEPTTAAMLMLGMAGLALRRRR